VLLNPRVYGRIEVALTDVADLLRSRATGAMAWAATSADGGRPPES
jgi:FMN reductase